MNDYAKVLLNSHDQLLLQNKRKYYSNLPVRQQRVKKRSAVVLNAVMDDIADLQSSNSMTLCNRYVMDIIYTACSEEKVPPAFQRENFYVVIVSF